MVGVAQKQCLETETSPSRSHSAWAVTKLLISSGETIYFPAWSLNHVDICHLSLL